MAAKITEKSETERLLAIYDNLPPKRFAVAQGLIEQAARIRVNLDKLSADIAVNGMTELFQQSDKVEPYKKTRPEADLFIKLDKNYQSIIKQLNDMIQNDDTPPDDSFESFRK
jgi:hypothetical protein